LRSIEKSFQRGSDRIALKKLTEANVVVPNQQTTLFKFSILGPVLEINVMCSVAVLHDVYAAPAPDKNFDAAPALTHNTGHSKPTFWKRTKINIRIGDIFSHEFFFHWNCCKCKLTK
jgi:hypothetical protein